MWILSLILRSSRNSCMKTPSTLYYILMCDPAVITSQTLLVWLMDLHPPGFACCLCDKIQVHCGEKVVPLRLFIYKRPLFLLFYSATKNTFYSEASTSKSVNADQRESCEDQRKGLYRPGVTRFREEVILLWASWPSTEGRKACEEECLEHWRS